MGGNLTFNISDWGDVAKECLNVFKEHYFVCLQINAITEILATGKNEYNIDNKKFTLYVHNAFAVRVLAATVAATMIKFQLERPFSPLIEGISPEPEMATKDWRFPLEETEEWKTNGHPVIKKWCDLFGISLSCNVDLNKIYYG
jgi:hypothetical protein